VRRFFGKPKKNDIFLKTEILDVTFGEKTENRKKRGGNEKTPKKNRYFTKIEPYLYEFVANESTKLHTKN
jgi:hypothetical protein